jgi:transposase
LAHHRTCGLRATGLVAPLVLGGATNGAAFLADVRQFLAPALSPGDIVVPDNLSARKASGVREALGACGAALLYLPPYGPDLNPIERVFSKPKRLPRDAAHRGAVASHRTPAQPVQPQSVRQLHPPPWLCTVRTITG